MRQGQHNRRGRNRNRKSQNPLSRSYESNGPDVKIRGNAQQIAEKYMSLGRDALTSGDHVLAENYLQHAEHYNRIIMAFREQEPGYTGEVANGGRRFGNPYDMSEGDDGDDDGMDQDTASRQMDPGSGRQPDIDVPVPFDDRHPPERAAPEQRHPQQHRQSGGERQYGDRGDRQPRHDRQNRGYDHRRDRRHEPREQREPREAREPRHQGGEPYQPRFPQAAEPQGNGYGQNYDRRPEPQPTIAMEPSIAVQPTPAPIANGNPIGVGAQPAVPSGGGQRHEGGPRRRERYVPTLNDQPEFLRRPVKRPRREGHAPEGAGEVASSQPEVDAPVKED